MQNKLFVQTPHNFPQYKNPKIYKPTNELFGDKAIVTISRCNKFSIFLNKVD